MSGVQPEPEGVDGQLSPTYQVGMEKTKNTAKSKESSKAMLTSVGRK